MSLRLSPIKLRQGELLVAADISHGPCNKLLRMRGNGGVLIHSISLEQVAVIALDNPFWPFVWVCVHTEQKRHAA